MKTRDIVDYHFEEAKRDLQRADSTNDPTKAIGSLIFAIEHLMSAILDQTEQIDALERLVSSMNQEQQQKGDGTLRIKK
jgi:hypothetical protein